MSQEAQLLQRNHAKTLLHMSHNGIVSER